MKLRNQSCQLILGHYSNFLMIYLNTLWENLVPLLCELYLLLYNFIFHILLCLNAHHSSCHERPNYYSLNSAA